MLRKKSTNLSKHISFMHCISRKNTLNSLCVTIINDPKPIVGVNVFIYCITQEILFRYVLDHKIANRNHKKNKNLCTQKTIDINLPI